MTLPFKESITLISKLSSAKVFNAFTILLSYYLSRLTGKAIVWGLPFSVSIEPTTSCNLRCPECPSGKRNFTRPTGMLSMELFRSMIDEVYQRLIYLTLYFQGEPYLNPDFIPMVQYAASKKIYTSTSTNGHFLSPDMARQTVESGLDRLIVSMDGTTQEVYEQYRVGGNLQKVLDGLKNLQLAKDNFGSSSPFVILQFIVFKPNEHQIMEVNKLAEKYGVNEVKIKTAQIYDFENGNSMIPENEKFSRYQKTTDGKFEIKNKLLSHCWRLWHASVMTWDGKIVPCCFDKDAHHIVGSMNGINFKQIWKGTAYQQFRNSVLRSRKEVDICSNCSEGTRVWV